MILGTVKIIEILLKDVKVNISHVSYVYLHVYIYIYIHMYTIFMHIIACVINIRTVFSLKPSPFVV